MVIRKTDVCRKYRINTSTLNNYINACCEADKQKLDINGKRYYTNSQAVLIKKLFGDFERYCFKTKRQMCIEYGVSRVTFKKMLAEVFGWDSEIVTSKNKLYTAREVEEIETGLGEP